MNNWKATLLTPLLVLTRICLSKLERSQTGHNGVDQIATSLQARKV